MVLYTWYCLCAGSLVQQTFSPFLCVLSFKLTLCGDLFGSNSFPPPFSCRQRVDLPVWTFTCVLCWYRDARMAFLDLLKK